MESGKKFIVGIFDDESILLSAVKKIRGNDVKIDECYTPYPVHGLDEELGYKRSRISIAAFIFGLIGTSLAFLMMIYMMGIDWPMIIGGKDHIAIPSFIPVAFEVTVLLAALGMVATFFIISNLKPYGKPKTYDIRSTDDKHVMAIDLAKNSKNTQELSTLLMESGASEVNEKNF
ncbi:quinol:electron acceptor oxidoreductase subunit ActD [Marivirga lumbricoides]